ncbi:MAG TPA: cupin domain-containing protein [Thermoplasmata archaeon]
MRKTAPSRATRWERIGPQVLQRVIFETEQVRFVLYRVAAGFHNTLHAHDYAQMGVVISGRGTHRTVLAIARAGRVRQEVQELPVRDGDCFYVPPQAPHELAVDGGRPMVLLEVTLPSPRPGHGSGHAAASPTRRGAKGGR